MHEEYSAVIPLDLYGKSNWTLKLSRPNNSSHVMVTLHWGDKVEPTHASVVPVEAFSVACNKILGPQVCI